MTYRTFKSNKHNEASQKQEGSMYLIIQQLEMTPLIIRHEGL